jgi:hypothetical protein
VAQTEDLLQFNRLVPRGLLGTVPDGSAASGLAGFRPADVHDGARWSFGAEILVVGDYPVHFRNGLIERVGKQRNAVAVHVAKFMLNRVQRWEKPARHV